MCFISIITSPSNIPSFLRRIFPPLLNVSPLSLTCHLVSSPSGRTPLIRPGSLPLPTCCLDSGPISLFICIIGSTLMVLHFNLQMNTVKYFMTQSARQLQLFFRFTLASVSMLRWRILACVCLVCRYGSRLEEELHSV